MDKFNECFRYALVATCLGIAGARAQESPPTDQSAGAAHSCGEQIAPPTSDLAKLAKATHEKYCGISGAIELIDGDANFGLVCKILTRGYGKRVRLLREETVEIYNTVVPFGDDQLELLNYAAIKAFDGDDEKLQAARLKYDAVVTARSDLIAKLHILYGSDRPTKKDLIKVKSADGKVRKHFTVAERQAYKDALSDYRSFLSDQGQDDDEGKSLESIIAMGLATYRVYRESKLACKEAIDSSKTEVKAQLQEAAKNVPAFSPTIQDLGSP